MAKKKAIMRVQCQELNRGFPPPLDILHSADHLCTKEARLCFKLVAECVKHFELKRIDENLDDSPPPLGMSGSLLKLLMVSLVKT
ncbi:hypothetical protein Poly41_65830 [Novipirellula artificiosorum]|uniref:Uncharacterized protein n=1 Tax=Novipirellula artificiosorum TaxID=2528016 RepID=A0A5C6D1R7_9BACT|nr:hypothetical protein Poly41_65830 [Novipirellula artificiosorum]